MTNYPQQLYVRIVNPGSVNEYHIFGPDPSDVSDTLVGESDSLEPTVARYVRVGTGVLHLAAPQYVEDTAT